jgi:hypothetical protein
MRSDMHPRHRSAVDGTMSIPVSGGGAADHGEREQESGGGAAEDGCGRHRRLLGYWPDSSEGEARLKHELRLR